MKLGETMTKEMTEIFMAEGKQALVMSHYDLAEKFPDYPVEAWRSFLELEDIKRYVAKERSILSDIELNKLLSNAANNKGQVGMAQMVTALTKAKQTEKEKDGPIFIYNAVPLNSKQRTISGIDYLEEDPFKV